MQGKIFDQNSNKAKVQNLKIELEKSQANHLKA